MSKQHIGLRLTQYDRKDKVVWLLILSRPVVKRPNEELHTINGYYPLTRSSRPGTEACSSYFN